MDSNNLIGYRVSHEMVCNLCHMKKKGGGYRLRQPVEGVFCSAQHAQEFVRQRAGGDKNAQGT
jgi:hypothetical protein